MLAAFVSDIAYQNLYFYNTADKSLEKWSAVWYNMYSIRKEVDTYG